MIDFRVAMTELKYVLIVSPLNTKIPLVYSLPFWTATTAAIVSDLLFLLYVVH